MEPNPKLIDWLLKAGFKEHSTKEKLYCITIPPSDSMTDQSIITAFVDFRKTLKGRRYYQKNNELYDDADHIGLLLAFKEARLQLTGETEDETQTKLVKPHTAKPPVQTQTNPDMFKPGKSYKVSGKETPNAALTQHEANERGISIQIIKAEQGNNFAMAHVKAIAKNGAFVEDVVYHDFNLMKDVVLLDLINEALKLNNKIIFESDKDGRPVLTPEYQKRLFERWIKMKYFSMRDAVTKASRRAQLKLLNNEWRDSDEDEGENLEERIVKN